MPGVNNMVCNISKEGHLSGVQVSAPLSEVTLVDPLWVGEPLDATGRGAEGTDGDPADRLTSGLQPRSLTGPSVFRRILKRASKW
jgi:hypothetical protein